MQSEPIAARRSAGSLLGRHLASMIPKLGETGSRCSGSGSRLDLFRDVDVRPRGPPHQSMVVVANIQLPEPAGLISQATAKGVAVAT